MERLVGTYIFDPEMNAGKMVFLTGPRQIGKTTFAKKWLASLGFESMYFNWDDPVVMKEYNRNPLYFRNIIDNKFKGEPVPLVFDEIHKHKNWRNILKGIYDVSKDNIRLLVTGSARLGLYKKSGDSLIGRYFSYQMFPLGLPEAAENFSYIVKNDEVFTKGDLLVNYARKVDNAGLESHLANLLTFGGFPEPFLKGSPRFHRRWQGEYKTLLAKEDIRDLSRIADIRGVEQLIEILPTKVGSPLSINSLREDTGYHHATIANWLEILKELYLIFTIRPWHKNILRSVKKEAKLYFYDWSNISDTGYRFENLIAVSLLGMASRLTETGLGNFEVMYIKDKNRHEVDFVLVKDNRPVALFEAKETDTAISAPGKFFNKKLNIPFYQIVYHCNTAEVFRDNCYVIPATQFLMLTG
ncbi:MAG: ATP-binding protein [Proteobacteria bacterium]|nr:ATP-binding protein [Pseudomonadota bacterium]